jgi:putative sigma-54 modulation protein
VIRRVFWSIGLVDEQVIAGLPPDVAREFCGKGVSAMRTVVKGKSLEVSEPLRAYAEEKIGRLDRYLDNISEATVELSVEKAKNAEERFVVQVTMAANGTILRGEEKASDLYTAIDSVLDIMQSQIVRYKEKSYRSKNKGRAPGVKGIAAEPSPEVSEEGEELPRVVKTKRFAIKPMDVEEAIDQMELLGHDFFVFFNAGTEEVNVLYRRRDGNYGLIEPEMI